jgi:hypothetical protein
MKPEMKRTSKTEILIETSRILTVRRRGGQLLTWCKECGARTQMPADEAAALCRVSSRAIYRWVESRQVHFTENAGSLLVCSHSILKSANNSDQTD